MLKLTCCLFIIATLFLHFLLYGHNVFMNKNHLSQGFTLIELIVVIVILSIMAVTAIPRFFSLSSNARKATIEALEGQMHGMVTIVFSQSIIRGLDRIPSCGLENTAQECTAAGYTYEANGRGTRLVYGYPHASREGIGSTLDLTHWDDDVISYATDCYQDEVCAGHDDDPNKKWIDTYVLFHKSRSSSSAVCYVRYITEKNVTRPQITSWDVDC